MSKKIAFSKKYKIFLMIFENFTYIFEESVFRPKIKKTILGKNYFFGHKEAKFKKSIPTI